jgi:UDP-N-acetylglucosamine--N-acetylmuramyl-(pentapeptide) pyrophosphoryl-undecaprenol N-acetylglucosamine transferase
LFPGLAVAAQLLRRDCAVMIMVSPKEVDQVAVRQAEGVKVVTLPGVGLTRGAEFAFLSGFLASFRASRRAFYRQPLQAVLAMGGFTCAPPLLAARVCRAKCYLHESNTIPGRANRWLSWLVDTAFVGFPEAATRLHARKVLTTGTPVRSQFQPASTSACRRELGLDPDRPVVLVMGGSQGAAAINKLVLDSLPELTRLLPQAQYLHLTGAQAQAHVHQAYANARVPAKVHPFLAEMHLALGAASVAISRSGASSMAELAAMQIPSILIPYPTATDNHQFHNARAFERTGAARMLDQQAASPRVLAEWLRELIELKEGRVLMQSALSRWHHSEAARQIADGILGPGNPQLSAPGVVRHPASRIAAPGAQNLSLSA